MCQVAYCWLQMVLFTCSLFWWCTVSYVLGSYQLPEQEDDVWAFDRQWSSRMLGSREMCGLRYVERSLGFCTVSLAWKLLCSWTILTIFLPVLQVPKSGRKGMNARSASEANQSIACWPDSRVLKKIVPAFSRLKFWGGLKVVCASRASTATCTPHTHQENQKHMPERKEKKQTKK